MDLAEILNDLNPNQKNIEEHRDRLSLFFSPAGYEISLKQTSSHSPSNPLSLICGFAIA